MSAPETPAGELTNIEWEWVLGAAGPQTPSTAANLRATVERILADRAAAVVQARAEDQARIEAALARHLFTLYPGQIVCDCEWTQEDEDTRAGEGRMIAAHIAHVTDALTATEDGDRP